MVNQTDSYLFRIESVLHEHEISKAKFYANIIHSIYFLVAIKFYVALIHPCLLTCFKFSAAMRQHALISNLALVSNIGYMIALIFAFAFLLNFM